MIKIIIVHGWGGSPKREWFPWLKKECVKKGWKVQVPQMPDTNHPKIKTWIPFLKKIIQNPDEKTYVIGHSIGCQTILRYLETINTKVGGIILVAPWMTLDKETINKEGKESIKIALPWVETPIDFKKVKTNIKRCIALFSDNDPFVPLENKKIFEKELDAKIIIEHNKGHFSQSDNIKDLPKVLEELEKMIQDSSK